MKMDRTFWRFRSAGILIAIGIVFVLSGCSDSSSGTRYSNQGTPSSPVTLTVGQNHSGSVAAYGTSFYRFSTTVDGVYTIALTNTASDLSWDLLNNAGTLIEWCDDFDWRADEICSTPSLPPATTFFVIVEEWDRVGGRFNLLVSAP